MSEKRPDPGVVISGGQVVAGNIGGTANSGAIHGDISLSGTPDRVVAIVTELLAELARLRTHLGDTPGSDAEPGDVDDVVEALDKPDPDIELAGTRWSRLLRRIPEPLRNLDTVAKIVHLVNELHTLAP